MKINKDDRDILLAALLQKYRDDCQAIAAQPVTTTSASLFGYDQYDPTARDAEYRDFPTIKKFMMEQGVLSEHQAMIFKASYLYKKLINEVPPISFNNPYLAACLQYINRSSSFPEFVRKYQLKLEKDESYYQGFIFSNSLRLIKEFSFSANFKVAAPYPIRQWRLHKRNDEDPDFLYTGTAEHLGSHLYGTLDNEASTRRMFFIIYVGRGYFQHQSYLLGSFQGVANDEHPTAGEIVLLKRTRDKVLLPGKQERNQTLTKHEQLDVQRAKVYLLLRRHIFGASTSIPTTTEQFAMLSPHDGRLKDLVGIYRIANYTYNGNLIESWFEIKDSFEAFLYTRFDNKSESEGVILRCELTISSFEGNYFLHVYAFHLGHVHNYAVYNLNFKPQGPTPGAVLMGAFCSCTSNSRNLLAQYMLGVKLSDKQATELAQNLLPRHIWEEAIAQHCRQDAVLNFMVQELQLILKEKEIKNKR